MYRPSCDHLQVGRQTGSLAWRLARGELGVSSEGWVWRPSEQDTEAGVMIVEYNVVTDQYCHGDQVREGFRSGTWTCNNLARKIETDWNMVTLTCSSLICFNHLSTQVYIARSEGCSDSGEVEWSFQTQDNVTIDRVVVLVDSDTFQSGSVR